VLGEPLEICSIKPVTGFYRDDCCDTGQEDIGSHAVCAVMTAAFLDLSKSRGNDLSTGTWFSGPETRRPLVLMCVPLAGGVRVVLRATHEDALAFCSFADLKRFAVDLA
jgi:uncharacterized protein